LYFALQHEKYVKMQSDFTCSLLARNHNMYMCNARVSVLNMADSLSAPQD